MIFRRPMGQTKRARRRWELEQGVSDRRMGIGDGEVDVEDLPGDETTAA